jgi:Patatin-like phospholipase
VPGPATRQKRYVFHPDVFAAEQKRIEKRRRALHPDWAPPSCPQHTVGLALSGGGIRSATFSLGVLQSLARRRLLPRIDYLSTVSGGGYTGCFLGSLFLPMRLRQRLGTPPATDFKSQCLRAYNAIRRSAIPGTPPPECAGVRSALIKGSATLVSAKKRKAVSGGWRPSQAFEWLRNNGRYLAPRGGGDLIYVAGMQIRNWVAVQWVVGIVIVACLVSFATARAWLIGHCPPWRDIEVFFLPKPGAAIYWSPGWALVGAFGLLSLIPPGLAYWVVHARVDSKDKLSWIPLWHEGAIVFLLVLGLTWAYSVLEILAPPRELSPFFWAAAGYVCISVLSIGTFFAGYWIERGANPGKLDLKSLRTRFTRWLRWTFQAFVCAAGLAFLGTIGQTVYANVRLAPSARNIAALTSAVGLIVAGARQLFKWMGAGNKQAHPRIPLTALAGAGALVLLLLTGGFWATLVQFTLWKGGPPPAVPDSVIAGQPRAWVHASAIYISTWGPDSVAHALDPQGKALIDGKPVAIDTGWMYVLLAGVGFLVVTTGTFLNFLNMSSLHQFYAARLTRAYLGATNRDRFKGDRVVAVTSPLGTDTIPLTAYYHEHLAAPVHLINVTLNQTRPSEGQLVQRDRKGMSMVVGPEYTIVNSAVFRRDDEAGTLTPVNPEAGKLADRDSGRLRTFQSEELDLGDWCAISGAAFSTGLGMRTSASLSLLAGLANVRLGYWWNFNSERLRSGLFAAYRYLWGELMADFKGPWKPFWFLTDGGHFDNTGVYELVRRRVGIILLCDNGCDPEYQFDDLGNLARKIRTDFGAEMEPITPAKPLGGHFATSKEFAKGKTRAGKCALAYWIVYPRSRDVGGRDRSLLIVLKPNMIPEAPLDVVEYRSLNGDFPHQSTLDQFFDDAQWESYRKLGEATADAVLDAGALRFNGWYKTLPSPSA